MRLSKSKIMVLLAERGLTMAQAAALVGMLPNNFSSLLSRGTCQTTTAGRIAAALEVPVSSIVEG